MKARLTFDAPVTSLVLSILSPQLPTVFAQDEAFTHQGRPNDSGQPPTSLYDLRITLLDALVSGTMRAGPLNRLARQPAGAVC
jgi:hypothetical protein